MGTLDRLFSFGRESKKSTAREDRSLLLDSALRVLGDRSTAVVTDRLTAVGVNIVFACVARIAGTLSSCPLNLYKRLPNGGKELALQHPLHSLMNAQPSPIQTAADFCVAMQVNLELLGNAFARVYRDKGGSVSYVEALNVSGYQIRINADPRKYPTYILTIINGKDGQSATVEYDGADLIHIKGLTWDGISGLSLINIAQDSLNLAAKIMRSGVAYYENGCRPGMVVTYPQALSPEALKNLRASIESVHRGEKNAHKLLILEEGAKADTMQHTATEADTTNFKLSVAEDICRVFGIPPHKVGILQRSTNNNIEQQAIEYTVDCILPRIRRWEQELNSKLLSQVEREEYFFAFDLDELKRGDTQSRFNAYGTALANGWMSVNEVRAKENMNPIKGGDIYLFPLNTAPISSLADGDNNQPAAQDPDDTTEAKNELQD